MLIEHAKSQLLLVDLQEKLMPAMVNPEAIMRQVGILLAAAAQLHVPVLASEQYPAGLGPTVGAVRPYLRPDQIIEKTEFSCFGNPQLRQRLDLAPEHLIIAGIETHVCVMQTALHGLASHRPVFIVADAVSSRTDDNKKAALQRLASAGAMIVTTEMVVFEWLQRADRPEFKAVSRLIR